MKILFAGGGSGGHFYPIIAVVEAIQDIETKEHLLPSEIYFVSNAPYDAKLLFNHNVTYIEVKTGKRRGYFSLKNFSDRFVTFFAILKSLRILFSIYPDVVFGKGGFASYPTLFAARLLNIPVMIHESDTVPGRVNLWASKFAKYIAVSYSDAVKFFPKDKTVVTGNPIRKEILMPLTQGSFKYLNLVEGIPVILILGGSQGSQIINNVILDALPDLLEKYQIIHQVGDLNKNEIDSRLETILSGIPNRDRYKSYPYLNDLTLRMSAGVSDLVISRAGSTIFEIASWGRGSIVIPITESNGDHQRQNAFHYARSGSSIVIEEQNLTPHLLVAEIDRYMTNPKMRKAMEDAALLFGKHNATAAQSIALQLLRTSLEHNKT